MTGVTFRTVEKFPEPAFSTLQREVFSGVQQESAEWANVIAKERIAEDAAAREPSFAAIRRVGAFDGEELVGWSHGWMERGPTFYMANSGVVASRRRQGIYTSLLHEVCKLAADEGANTLRSQHSVLNNAVVIAKLKFGFVVSGLSLTAGVGTLVELTYHLSPARAAVYRARSMPFVAAPPVKPIA